MDPPSADKFPHSENPEEEPFTPRKKPQFREQAPSPAPLPNRIKFKYTVVQKPRASWVGGSMILGWAVLMAVLFYLGYCEKLHDLHSQAATEQANCQVDFQKNKCQLGLKATLNFCHEKRQCINADLNVLAAAKVSLTFILGEVLKDFAEGAGLYVSLGGLAMILAVIRRPTAREVRRQYLQYCH